MRKQRRLTQNKVIKKIGHWLTVRALSEIENGKRLPTFEEAYSLAAFFNKTVKELWPQIFGE